MALQDDVGTDVGGDRRLRTALLIVGIVAVLVGVASLVLPHATLFAVAWVFGVYLLVSGLSMIVRAFARGIGTGRRTGLVVLGALILAGGIVALIAPPVGVRWIAFAIGFAWLLEGVTLLYAPTPTNRALTIGAAVLSIVIGVLVINLPSIGAALAVVAIAGFLILFGIVQIALGIILGRADRSEPPAGRAA